MAKMGSRKHLKRYKAPKSWPIHPKEDTWTVKPSAGSHSIDDSIPLTLVIRDVLKLADNSREAKRIINSGNVLVDGRVVKDYKFPVGFMDIIEIPKTGESYRVLLDRKGRLQLILIDDNSAKLSKIVNKSTIKGGKTQLNLHDGKNIIIDEDAYSVGDVICLNVPEQEIVEVYPLQEGATVLVTGGKHTGELGTVTEIIENKSSNPNTIIIENSSKDDFLTLKDYAFVIGTDAPTISLLEVNKWTQWMKYVSKKLLSVLVLVKQVNGEAGEKLERAITLLEQMFDQSPVKTFSKVTNPEWGIRKRQPIACKLTLRGEKADKAIEMVLEGISRNIRPTQFDAQGNLSFGIKEHIDIPGMRYNPDIGIFGMNVSVTFEKPGYRIARRKIRQKKVPQKHRISKEETMKFMEENFKVNYVTE